MSKGTSGFSYLASAFGGMFVTPEPTVDLQAESRDLFKAAVSGNKRALQEIVCGMLNESEWKFAGLFSFEGESTCKLYNSSLPGFKFTGISWSILREAHAIYVKALGGDRSAIGEIILFLFNKKKPEFCRLFSVIETENKGNKCRVTCMFLGSRIPLRFIIPSRYASRFM